jgi:hypothetical protein
MISSPDSSSRWRVLTTPSTTTGLPRGLTDKERRGGECYLDRAVGDAGYEGRLMGSGTVYLPHPVNDLEVLVTHRIGSVAKD